MQNASQGSGLVATDSMRAPGSDLYRRMRDAFNRRPFLRDVSVMLSGAAGGQLFSLLLAPVLTRLYSPAQFGMLSVYLALLAVIVVIGSLRYELALPLVKSERNAINLVALCLSVLIATTSFVAICSFLLPAGTLDGLSPGGLGDEHLATYRGLIPVGFFCLGAFFIALYWATRSGQFPAIAVSRLRQGVVGPLSQIGLGIFGVGTMGLLLGSILGQSAGTFNLLWRQLRSQSGLVRKISRRRMAYIALRYRRFALLSSWTGLLDAAGGNRLLYFLVPVLYSVEIAGFIFLIERVVSRPLSIIGTSILQVFVGEAGKTVATDPAKLAKRFRQVIACQAALAAIWVILANVGGLLLFTVIFGEEWDGAIPYLQAISLAYFAQATIQPVFHTLQILERQAMAGLWQISRISLNVAVFVLSGVFALTAPVAILLFSVVQAFSCVALLVLIYRAIQHRAESAK